MVEVVRDCCVGLRWVAFEGLRIARVSVLAVEDGRRGYAERKVSSTGQEGRMSFLEKWNGMERPMILGQGDTMKNRIVCPRFVFFADSVMYGGAYLQENKSSC